MRVKSDQITNAMVDAMREVLGLAPLYAPESRVSHVGHHVGHWIRFEDKQIPFPKRKYIPRDNH